MIKRSIGLGYLEVNVFNVPTGTSTNPYTRGTSEEKNPWSQTKRLNVSDEELVLLLETLKKHRGGSQEIEELIAIGVKRPKDGSEEQDV